MIDKIFKMFIQQHVEVSKVQNKSIQTYTKYTKVYKKYTKNKNIYVDEIYK